MPKTQGLKTFYYLLANNLVASVINFTVWFAITFFSYLETQSVFATALIAGLYLIMTASLGIWFGSIVDHHKKKSVMLVSSIGSMLLFAASLAVYMIAGREAFSDPTAPVFWILVALLITGVGMGNLRTIAMPTTVTLLVPESRRDRANGLLGSAFGVSFLVTSVISGLLVGFSGMFHVLLLGVVGTLAVLVHLFFIKISEKSLHETTGEPKRIDIRGTIKLVAGVPGLFALILFTTFNNFLGGVYMSLMDAYGLSLVSVEAWGLLWGVLSTGFIVGGLIIAKTGLGKNPLRTLLLVNVIMWAVSSVFTIQASIILLAIGMFIYLCIVPFAEASEQTILQRVVPYQRQGRVFGFAQSVEQAAAPLTALMIGPIAQFAFIPFMTTGKGAELIGSWYGTGASRGLALVFTVTGLIGLVATIIAMRSKYYRQLSERYKQSHTKESEPAPTGDISTAA